MSEYIDGVTFIVTGTEKRYHSLRDFGLVLCEAPTRDAPEPDRDSIEIPGGNGFVDVTEAVYGFTPYKSRSITIRLMNPRYGAVRRTNERSKVYNALHGRRVHIIFDDDLSFYYEGIINVATHSPELHRDIISLSAQCQPYKLDLTTTLEPWLWDDLSFHGGIIHRHDQFTNIVVMGLHSFTIVGRRMEATPKFIVSSTDGNGLTVQFGGIDYNVPDGTTVIPQIVIREGVNILQVSGSGTISIEYRGGEL